MGEPCVNTSGFLPSGFDEHQRAHQQHLKALQERLKNCSPEERTAIERQIEQAQQALRDAEDDRILW